MREIVMEGVRLKLPLPAGLELRWIGREDLVNRLLAAWLVMGPGDRPMSPRLIGRPGVGKTTLAYAAARRRGAEVYLFQATMDTRPEDLLLTPVVDAGGGITYAASPLVAAIITGQTCILDEGNRMSEKAWASLAPLLDDRRYVESIVTGLKIPAHPDFRLAVTINEDSSTYEIPEYIHSRLQPQIRVDFPDEDEEYRVLTDNLPFAPDEVRRYVARFLASCHEGDEPVSSRDGINLVRYALKLARTLGVDPLDCLGEAFESVLDPDAARYLPPRDGKR